MNKVIIRIILIFFLFVLSLLQTEQTGNWQSILWFPNSKSIGKMTPFKSFWRWNDRNYIWKMENLLFYFVLSTKPATTHLMCKYR